jgi:hypothetical protein
MKQDAAVYDLGAIDPDPGLKRRPQAEERKQAYPRRETPPGAAGDPRFERSPGTWVLGPTMLVPGSGHILRGEIAHGLAFLGATGFVAALGWALVNTLDRLGPTLGLLGMPRALGVWTLGVLFIALATVHVANVLTAAKESRSASTGRVQRPLVAALASLVVPGWGQAISGRLFSAALFLAACWVAAGSWILVWPPVRALLDQHGLYLPQWLVWMTSPGVRWTLPVVVWALATYDAFVRAERRN